METDELPTRMMDELPTRMVIKIPLGTLLVTEPAELKQFLDSNPDGTIAFVDCQNDAGKLPELRPH